MKNKIIMAIAMMSVAACSSFQPKEEELKQSKTCNVWKEDRFGVRRSVEVEPNKAKQKMTCWIMGMFACAYNNYSFQNETEIKSDMLGKVGELKGNTMSIQITGSTITPFQIKKELAQAEYQIKDKVGSERTSKVYFNQQCETKQVALGVAALVGY